MNRIFYLVLSIIMFSCGQKTETKSKEHLNTATKEGISNSAQHAKKDTIELNGYDELADEQNRKRYTVSEYNTDIASNENIERPTKSQIINSAIDTTLLFGIWTLDPNGPHADFWLTVEDFYVVDYDGDGSMPYLLIKDSIEIFYNDFKQKGKIEKVTSDSLTIHWEAAALPTTYTKWEE